MAVSVCRNGASSSLGGGNAIRIDTMSWYLANEKRIIDQFATIAGLKDLREAAESYPNLRDFFVEGVTENIRQCTEELNQLANETSDQDVKVTAQGLAKLMRGQGVVVVTQGFG